MSSLPNNPSLSESLERNSAGPISTPNESTSPVTGLKTSVMVVGPGAEHISTTVVADTPQPNIVRRAVHSVRRRHTISSIQKEQKAALPASERLTFRDRYVIVPDSELSKVGGKKCQKYDKYNEAIWKRNLEHFQRMQRVHNRRAHSAIRIENPLEELPQPSNYERFVIHEQRHQPTDCLEQTSAILYLCSHPDYQLVDDLGSTEVQRMQESRPNVIFFEPHQAIELAHARVQATGDVDFTTIIYRLRNGFTISDVAPRPPTPAYRNIDRNASQSSLHHAINTATRSYSGYIAPPIAGPHAPSGYNKDTVLDMSPPSSTTFPSWVPLQDPVCATFGLHEMKCDVPEHHGITEKVQHFDNLAISSSHDTSTHIPGYYNQHNNSNNL